MAFINERCPNCGKSISKQAEFCNSCGSESATAWVNCSRCQSSIGSDSKFCWNCGEAQDFAARRALYGDRWFRSPNDFAVRVEISSPGEALRHGIQVDEGTLALMFQDGKYVASLESGYHSTDSFFQRLLKIQPAQAAHVVLLDARSAEIDFQIEDIRARGNLPVDVRTRLLFRIADAGKFVTNVIGSRNSFTTGDLAALFQQDVANVVQEKLRDSSLEDLMVEPRAREVLEESLIVRLSPVLERYGLQIDGVRLARFGGQAIDYITSKLGEVTQLMKEHEVNRELRDAMRVEKASAFRDERELEEIYEQITHEYGMKSADREEEKRRFTQFADHQHHLAGLRQDFELRREEIANRIEEQKLKHASDLAEVAQELSVRGMRFQADLGEAEQRAALARKLQVEQSKADLETAGSHWDLSLRIKEEKVRLAAHEERLNLDLLREKISIMQGASSAALLAVLSGEQADRVMKLAELEMRKGLGAEEALALVAEQSPEIAPAVAEALRARYAGPGVRGSEN